MTLQSTPGSAAAALARHCLPLLLIPALSAGCLETDEGRKDTRDGFHDVTVNWHIRNVDGTLVSSCPPGFTTLVTHMYHDGYVEPPDGLIKTPCAPEGSFTQPLPTEGQMPDVGTHQVNPVRQTGSRRARPRTIEHRRRTIDANHVDTRSRQRERDAPRPASELEDRPS